MNKFRMQQAALGLTLACALGLAQAQTPATPDDSLFRALGGLPVIERVVQDFMDNMLADARIRHTFDNSNVKRLR